MKYIVIVADGMSDYPLEELEGRTPLEKAKTPNMDYIAKKGQVGRASMVPRGMPPGSDVANLSIFGYNPKEYYTGRGPIEAANLGIKLSAGEVAFRCNLVTISGEIMTDYSSGHISTKEASMIIDILNQRLANKYIQFYCGTSYRHILCIKPMSKYPKFTAHCAPPHDITGKEISRYLPDGPGDQFLIDLMEMSNNILMNHEVNQVRVDLKENPANMIWLWGQGQKPNIPSFYSRFKIKGSVISAVDLIKGMGRLMGLSVVDVPNITGYYDTDYAAKADYALKSLEEKDFVLIHVEAPDEASHNGDLREKIAAIENIDKEIVSKCIDYMKKRGNCRLLVLPDHPTPVKLRTHTRDAICYTMCGEGIAADNNMSYSEYISKNSEHNFKDGYKLMEAFI
ncbi:MAG: cofactor-independent phosphoglycerate mutase [Candidatus Kappaea frigidicola]|nr:cofactor-independent phosphoglycerate mutase [Candidatus Kappaea frigidicola]